MLHNSRYLFSAALLGILVGVSPVGADSEAGDTILTRSLDKLPKNKGTKAANDIAGQEIFKPEAETKPEKAKPLAPEVAVAVPADANVIAEDSVKIPPAGLTPQREFDPDGDPITQRATQILDETGTLGRQRQLAEAMILMDQRLKFNRKVEETLVALGPNAEIEVAPGVFRSYAGTPAAIRATIAHARLQQELAVALAEASGEEATEEVKEDKVADLPSRDDGTGFQSMDKDGDLKAAEEPKTDRISQMLAEAEARMARREAEIRRIASEVENQKPKNVEQAEPVNGLAAVSLREVYGASGVFAAIIDTAGQRSEIRDGDKIAGGYTVSRIGPSFIEVTKDGESTRISL
jgi:hypothetical protein